MPQLDPQRPAIERRGLGGRRGTFTDAAQDRPGLVAAAHGGTRFLDEIADLPTGMQAKLRTMIELGTIRSVGDARERPVDVRLIAATNQPLAAAVEAGRFRADLRFRLDVLANRIERAVVFSDHGFLRPEDLADPPTSASAASSRSAALAACAQAGLSLVEVEDAYLTVVTIVAVNVDRTRPEADRFLQRVSFDLPVAFDPDAKVLGAYGAISMPTMFLFDRSGQLVWPHTGYSEEKGFTELDAALGGAR